MMYPEEKTKKEMEALLGEPFEFWGDRKQRQWWKCHKDSSYAIVLVIIIIVTILSALPISKAIVVPISLIITIVGIFVVIPNAA